MFTRNIILLVFCLCVWSTSLGAQNLEQKYQELKSRIEKNYNEPKGDPGKLEPYLQWMEIKAKDRDEVKSILENIKQNQENKHLKQWEEKFSSLLNLAQGSGETTVNGAVLKFMRIRDPRSPKAANWETVIERLKNYGRKIYLKARETRFATQGVKAAAKCMINFSLRDVEGNPTGKSVYKRREGRFGSLDEQGNLVIPDRDFDTDCEPRSSFTYFSRGEPAVQTDWGLDWINQVCQEARWWNFGDAEKDATDLMEEFFKDSMCKIPPNGCDKGHKSYKELAKRYSLPKALQYNQGFYGTVFGKVEAITSSGKKPVENAKITIQSLIDNSIWEGFTDENGKYEIAEVLLHKECKPLKITVIAGNDKKSETFKGPLQEPDPSYRYEKNFVFTKGDSNFQVFTFLGMKPKITFVTLAFLKPI